MPSFSFDSETGLVYFIGMKQNLAKNSNCSVKED